MALTSPARAAVYTWIGTGTTTAPTAADWNSTAHWSGGLPVSAATTELDFATNTAYTAMNDISTPFDLNILSFIAGTNTGTPIISQDQLQFVANGGTNPVINENENSGGSISAPIDFEVPLTVQGTGTGLVTLSGTLTGAGTLSKTSSTFQLNINKANSYTGGTTISSPGGIVVAQANNALGTGTITLGSSSMTGPKLTLNGVAGTSYTYPNDLVLVGNAGIEADVNASIGGPGTVATSIASGATLSLQNGTGTAVTGTISNVITGLGSVARVNVQLGSWILSGNNTYAGTTAVSAGLLAVTGTTSGQGSYSVTGNTLAYGILAGNGTIGLATGKTLMVTGGTAGNGVLEPTASTGTAGSIGILTVLSTGTGSSVTLGNLSTLSIAVGASGGSSELVVGSAATPVTLTLSNTNMLAITGTVDGSNYIIARSFSTIGGTFAGLTVDGTSQASNTSFSSNGFTYNVDYNVADAGGFDIQLVAVPEPSTVLSILTLVAIGCLFQRSRTRLGA